MTSPRTYIFAGGGSGGHLFPGIAVAEELKSRQPNVRILFVGSEREFERSIVARHGFEHQSLPAESLSVLKRNPWRFVSRNWTAWRSARKLISDLHPIAIIGLGGFASAPMVWQAARFRCPTLLLEQNVVPGRTNRILSRSSNVVCTSFEESRPHFSPKAKVIVTGNPVRKVFVNWDEHIQDKSPSIHELLVLGGSQGAESLNKSVVSALELLCRQQQFSGSEWKVVHQTGPRQLDDIRRKYADLRIRAEVAPFFDDMAARYRNASLVVSRSGATTLAELACCGIAMILVPFPFAADDHQKTNALVFEKAGAAIHVAHRLAPDETATELATAMTKLMADETLREKMSQCAKALSHPEATRRVTDILQEISGT